MDGLVKNAMFRIVLAVGMQVCCGETFFSHYFRFKRVSSSQEAGYTPVAEILKVTKLLIILLCKEKYNLLSWLLILIYCWRSTLS